MNFFYEDEDEYEKTKHVFAPSRYHLYLDKFYFLIFVWKLLFGNSFKCVMIDILFRYGNIFFSLLISRV